MVTRTATNVSVAMRSMLAAALLPPVTHSVVASATKSTCMSPTAHSLIQLIVSGFKKPNGVVNVWIYGGNADDFLVRDKRILRLKFPDPSDGPMAACIAVPGPGRYAVATHHDIESDGKRDMSDGIGFSGNPHLSVIRLKSGYAQTSFVVSSSVRRIDLRLNYRAGLSIKPVSPRTP